MTSQINPNNINGNYPVAGQDNNSQGFRDNFTNTSNNFQYAADEITDLQSKAVLKQALTGGTLDNNMLNSPLINALISDFAANTVSIGAVTTTATIDYSAGHFQNFTLNGNASVAFSSTWPVAGQTGVLVLDITVSNPLYTVTFPSTVSVNKTGIQGYNISTNVLSFAAAGTYRFSLSTNNGGSTIVINQTNNILTPFNNSTQVISAAGNVSLATTTTAISGITANATATLSTGVSGQIKTFVAANLAGHVATISLTNAGWNAGSTGNVVFTANGQGCSLQSVTVGSGTNWFCIGNNGATFS